MLVPFLYIRTEKGGWNLEWMPTGISYKSAIENPLGFIEALGLIVHAILLPAVDAENHNNIVWIRWDLKNQKWEQL